MFKRLSVVLFVDSWTLFSVSPSVFTSLEHSNSDSNKTLIVFVHLSIYLHLYLSIIVPIVFSYVLLCLYLSLFPFLVFLSFFLCLFAHFYSHSGLKPVSGFHSTVSTKLNSKGSTFHQHLCFDGTATSNTYTKTWNIFRVNWRKIEVGFDTSSVIRISKES